MNGKTIELAKIPKRTPEWVVQFHGASEKGAYRGAIPNRAARRAVARSRGVKTPPATLRPYEKASLS